MNTINASFVVPTLTSRVEKLYAERLEKIRSAIVQAINTIPFMESGGDLKIKFAIQMHIPEDLWCVMQDLFSKKDWSLHKETRSNNVDLNVDIHNIAITHLRVG